MGKNKKSKTIGKQEKKDPTLAPPHHPLKEGGAAAGRRVGGATDRRPRITLQDVLAVDRDDDSSDMPPESEWDASALALKQKIESGAFDHLLDQKKNKKSRRGRGAKDDDDDDDDDDNDDEESSIEEVILDDDDDNDADDNHQDESEEGENDEHHAVASDEGNDLVKRSAKEDGESSEASEESEADENHRDEDEEDEQEEKEGEDLNSSEDENNEQENVDNDDDEEDEGDHDDRKTQLSRQNNINSKALYIVTESLQSRKRDWPWAETFDIVSTEPLPFDKKLASDDVEQVVDIHDDLKREVAFYDMALAAVAQAREKCSMAKIPFTRPDDFFAEMVKTDDHMAKVKDRLIFETKKMDAVAQRKSNKEFKLRAKEAQANKVAEKAKRKREHFASLDDWAQSAASKRGRRVVDEDDEDRLRSFGRQGSGTASPNKKRLAADKKFGFGGKRGRFKQNDRKTLNDTSAFNPRGSKFAGGMKATAKNKGSGGGGGKNKRQGKRARDAHRAKR